MKQRLADIRRHEAILAASRESGALSDVRGIDPDIVIVRHGINDSAILSNYSSTPAAIFDADQ